LREYAMPRKKGAINRKKGPTVKEEAGGGKVRTSIENTKFSFIAARPLSDEGGGVATKKGFCERGRR